MEQIRRQLTRTIVEEPEAYLKPGQGLQALVRKNFLVLFKILNSEAALAAIAIFYVSLHPHLFSEQVPCSINFLLHCSGQSLSI